MINKLKPKSDFARNVLTLMTGTTIAQAIPIAISPILTRIYTPDDFGVFALYMSVVSLISVMATGKYELAIMLPEEDEDAINIVALSMLITFIISFLVLLIVVIFNSKITSLLGNPEISNWLFFIPATVFLTGLYQSFNYWSNRKKQYKRLSISRVIKNGTISTTNLAMGFNGVGSGGLILSSVFGQGLATMILGKIILKEDKEIIGKIKKFKIIALAKRYIKFPKFLIFAHGMNTLSSQTPTILFSSLFNLSVVGFYMMVRRVVGLPASIIASSISDVFRQRASEKYIQVGNCKIEFINTFKKLFLISFVPFLIFYFIAPGLFSFVLGKEWAVAGIYAQILTPMFFLQFITSPLSSMFMIAEKQKLDLYWQISLLLSVTTSIYIGKYIFNNVETTLRLFCLAYSICYSINLFMTYKFSKGRGNETKSDNYNNGLAENCKANSK